MDIQSELKSLLKREPKAFPVFLGGKHGFIAEYFNFADRFCVSKLFSETKEGALSNLLDHLKEKGESDGTDTESK